MSDFDDVVEAVVADSGHTCARVTASLSQRRPCVFCRRSYVPNEEAYFQYVFSTEWYVDGTHESCVRCWFGVGSRDADDADDVKVVNDMCGENFVRLDHSSLSDRSRNLMENSHEEE